jgi:hypothetical protein
MPIHPYLTAARSSLSTSPQCPWLSKKFARHWKLAPALRANARSLPSELSSSPDVANRAHGGLSAGFLKRRAWATRQSVARLKADSSAHIVKLRDLLDNGDDASPKPWLLYPHDALVSASPSVDARKSDT